MSQGLIKLNIGIVAHVDAGKTTLAENILYLGGAISQVGLVDSGSTQTDSMDVEHRRGISVRAAATSFTLGNVKFNLIDTPAMWILLRRLNAACKFLTVSCL